MKKKKLLHITVILITLLVFIVNSIPVLAAIDIGEDAIDRASSIQAEGYIVISLADANETGYIDTVYWYQPGSIYGARFLTLYSAGGNDYTVRDIESKGNFYSGGAKSASVNLDVQAGDFIGIWCTGASSTIDKADSGGAGYRQGSSSAPTVSGTYTLNTVDVDGVISLYGNIVGSAVEPTASTSAATSVSYTTATVNGNITDFGTATSAAVTFEYGLTTGYGSTANASESPVSGTGTVHADLSSLDDGTLYHFRVKVDADDTDPVYGDDATFTTLSQSPTVTTSAASSVTMDKDGVTGGTFNGNLTSLGDNTEVDISFIYGTTSACADGGTTPATVTETGAFNNSLEFPDDWIPGATYYYKAKAVGDTYTDPQYGSAQSIVFTMPSFTTEEADYTSPGAATATLNGNISNLQKASDCYGYFEYGYDTSYGSSTTPQTLNATGDFDDEITDFLRNTTVHYRAVIEVGATTANGSDETFLIAPPELAQVGWYEPNAIISGTTLPDRATTDGTQNGVITWGTNPNGITIVNGLLISNGSIGVVGKNQHDAIPALNTDMTGTDTAQTGNILFSLFSPIAWMTSFPLWILFTILGLIAIVLSMIYVTKHTQNQMLGAGAGLVVTFLFYKIGVFDWWMFFVPVVMFAAILVMERKPSL